MSIKSLNDERNTVYEYLQVLRKAQTMIYGIKEPQSVKSGGIFSGEPLYSENSD